MNINGINKNRAAITEFNGLKIRNNAGASDFVDMQNIDSHEYPYFSTRRKNYYLNKGTYGMGVANVTDDMHGWCAYDTDFYYVIKRGNDLQVEKLAKNGTVTVVINNATMQSKSAIASDPNWKLYNRIMVVMGGDIVIYPDWIKYNIKDSTTTSLSKVFEKKRTTTDLYDVMIYMCKENGEMFAPDATSETDARNNIYATSTSSTTGYFSNGSAQTWAKTNERYYFEFDGTGTEKKGTVSRFYNSTSMWMPEDEYCCMEFPIGFFDCSTETELDNYIKSMELEYNKDLDLTFKMSGISSLFSGKLNGNVVIHRIAKKTNGILKLQIILKGINIWNDTFNVRQTAQDMVYWVVQDDNHIKKAVSNFTNFKLQNELYNSLDFIVQEGNRLFACSNSNHEIYASKLGDPSLWKEFKGISTDSYAATVGSPGKFTGAAVFNNTPIFFKENCIHRITGNTPASFNISYDYYDGIKDGCSNSIVRVGNYLIYYSKGGFVYYTGSQPERIDRQLGDKRYKNIFAGEKEGHYIAAVVEQETNKTYLLDFDMDLNQWYKHQDNNPRTFRVVNVSNDLYTFHKEKCADYTSENNLLHTFIECIGRNLNESQTATAEDDFEWYAESGWLIKESTNKKYITKMLFNMHLDPLADIRIYLKYDYNDEWELISSYSNTNDCPETVSIPLIPQRCESMQYKIEGKGKVIIYSITYDISEGSEF